MHENPEMHVSSAWQLKELREKQEEEELRIKTAENLAREQVALLKESNELAKQSLAKQESNKTNLVDVKPKNFGVSLNLNEAWRRIKQWRSKENT